jgi:hypothetical protein
MSAEKDHLVEKLMEIEANARFVLTELRPGFARSRVQRILRASRHLRARLASDSLSVLDLSLYQPRPETADPEG